MSLDNIKINFQALKNNFRIPPAIEKVGYELFCYLSYNIMWGISKLQIYISKITNCVKEINARFKEGFINMNNNKTIEIHFVKDNLFILYYDFIFKDNKLTRIEENDYQLLNTNKKSIYTFNEFCDNKINDLKLFPDESTFDFYILSNYDNDFKTDFKIGKNIKDISYIYFPDNILFEHVDKLFMPFFLEITYPNMKPISFKLKTELYNFLIVGNVLDKHFFNYFIKEYCYDELCDNENYCDFHADKYSLLVIDHNVKRHAFTEKDVFTISMTRDQDNKITYNIFN
jgi:hypothetical protein